MNFNQDNWELCLDTLGFYEQKNSNGCECYDVFDDTGNPMWQYEGWYGRERLFYFFSGIIFGRMKEGVSGG